MEAENGVLGVFVLFFLEFDGWAVVLSVAFNVLAVFFLCGYLNKIRYKRLLRASVM